MDKKYMIGMFSVLVFAMFVVGINIGSVGNSEVGDGLNYGSLVEVSERKAGSDEWVVIAEKENTVVEDGFDMVMTSLGVGTENNVDWLALGNGLGPSGSDSALAGIYADSGLAIGVGAYNVNPASHGNWSISKTFTCTAADKTVNSTALYEEDGTTLFAGTTFTPTTLQDGDSLKVNYTLWVS